MAFVYKMLNGLPWVVVDVAEKCEARRDQLLGARLFDEYQDHVLRGASPDEGTVEERDLAATWTVNSNIDLGVGVRWVAAFHRAHRRGLSDLHAVLGQRRGNLLDVPEPDLPQLGRVLDQLTDARFRLASVTKTLAARRPNGVPVLDRVVSWMLKGSAGGSAEELLPPFARAARALRKAHPDRARDATRITEKLLWFDGLFPVAGGRPLGTAQRLVDVGWRLIVWPVEGSRGSAGVYDGNAVDGCVANLPAPRRSAGQTRVTTVDWMQLGADERARLTEQLVRAGYPEERRPLPPRVLPRRRSRPRRRGKFGGP